MDALNPPWPQFFRQLIVSNSGYWLQCAQDDMPKLLPELPQVLKALSYALSLAEAWQPARDLILQLSPVVLRQGQGVAWEEFLTRAIARSPQERDPAEIDFRLQLGNLYRLQGRLSEAQGCLQEALALHDQYELRTHFWTVLNQLALVTRLFGHHEEALVYCQQVLAEPNLPVTEQAEALNVMGLVAHDRRQWEQALDCFEQALNLYRSLNDSYHMARMLTNQGMILQRTHRLDEAEESYLEAIQRFRASDDRVEVFKPITNLGNVFLTREAYKTAIQQYQEALPAFQQCNYLVEIGHVYNNLGLAYTGLADWPAAEAYYVASTEVWHSLEDSYNLANVLDNLGTMFIKAGQLKQAHDTLSQALHVLRKTQGSLANKRLQQIIEDHLSQLGNS